MDDAPSDQIAVNAMSPGGSNAVSLPDETAKSDILVSIKKQVHLEIKNALQAESFHPLDVEERLRSAGSESLSVTEIADIFATLDMQTQLETNEIGTVIADYFATIYYKKASNTDVQLGP